MLILKQLSDNRVKDLAYQFQNKITEIEYKLDRCEFALRGRTIVIPLKIYGD